jgi:hypothetical protein
MKGEYDAIHQSAVMRKCPGVITPQPVTATAETPAIDVAAEPKK